MRPKNLPPRSCRRALSAIRCASRGWPQLTLCCACTRVRACARVSVSANAGATMRARSVRKRDSRSDALLHPHASMPEHAPAHPTKTAS
eukprot:6198026-Pleurochrysis_carterae.AAC.4